MRLYTAFDFTFNTNFRLNKAGLKESAMKALSPGLAVCSQLSALRYVYFVAFTAYPENWL